MVENSRHIHSSDPPVQALDEDMQDPRFAHYRYRRSREAGIYAEEPVPLFLSNDADNDEPQIPEVRSRAFSPSRILTFISAGSIAALVLALFSVDATRAVIVNAKASFAGAASALPSLPPSKPIQPVAGNVPAANAELPSRDDIAAAYQAAIKSQIVPREAPVIAREAPAAPPPARRIDSDELAALLKRAKNMLAIGDIASARLLLERAANAQEAGAALLLARTYDPGVLGTPDMRSITPDPAQALAWYRMAAELGSTDAKARLAQLQN